VKIEELIRLHSQALDRKVEKNTFPAQRIKARLKDREQPTKPSLWGLLRKPVLVYGFLFILFTILNFILITGLEKRNTPKTGSITLTQVNVSAFQPDYPGSISHAWREVVK
jgi:hypothetical protein